MSTSISRSTFLKGLAGCGVAALSGKLYFDWESRSQQFPCQMLGPSRSIGHKLRDRATPHQTQESTPSASHAVTIVGGGMAGLSAAWWLSRNGVSDFVILELEDHVGGNSTSGKNQFSAYPWGAHYVPIANQESEYVRILFEELKIIQAFDRSGQPVYDELYLCHEPQERLFKDGIFQEGLVPKRGLQKSELQEIGRFFDLMNKFKRSVGDDGKHAFAIPLDLSSQDSEFTKLDRISMKDWLEQNGFRSKPLLWYVNYCCRDDYGSTTENVSAWAGVHYFAGRRGTAANAEPNSVVTWPEGNGFIVNKLKQKLDKHIETGALVTEITIEKDHVLLSYLQTATNKSLTIKSDCVVFAGPRFVAKHVIRDYKQHDGQHGRMNYAPWLVANISLKDIPEGKGLPAAWDNVSYYSPSLGYVVATHQDISTRPQTTVITYYYPLSEQEPVAARQTLFNDSSQKWSKIIVDDLEQMHPGISKQILSMDLWPWGHGMIRPSVGFIWSDERRQLKESVGKMFFAHSDMSGMSNFEEAQFHGVEAAKKVLIALEQHSHSLHRSS